jgi:hypothetical protein
MALLRRSKARETFIQWLCRGVVALKAGRFMWPRDVFRLDRFGILHIHVITPLRASSRLQGTNLLAKLSKSKFEWGEVQSKIYSSTVRSNFG